MYPASRVFKSNLPPNAFHVHLQWTPAEELESHRVELLFHLSLPSSLSNVFLCIFNCLLEKALVNRSKKTRANLGSVLLKSQKMTDLWADKFCDSFMHCSRKEWLA